MLDALHNDPRMRYPDALHPLLTLGDPEQIDNGLAEQALSAMRAADIPALLTMATDRALWKSDGESPAIVGAKLCSDRTRPGGTVQCAIVCVSSGAGPDHARILRGTYLTR